MAKDSDAGVLTLFEKIQASDLDQIDVLIDTKEKELDGLRALRKVVDVKLNGRARKTKAGTHKAPPPSQFDKHQRDDCQRHGRPVRRSAEGRTSPPDRHSDFHQRSAVDFPTNEAQRLHLRDDSQRRRA